MYSAAYQNSRAIVIGIDKYQSASPLLYAVSDATAISGLLITNFGFEEKNVTLLTDSTATRANILGAFFKLSGNGTTPDDRVFIFFAGHGHTEVSLRSDIGFLVPQDGSLDDLSTLIRWEELTHGSDLIRAKHVLFIMDACYGGLAVTRSLNAGAMRFMSDMLRRVSRQVLTAGKADEVVSDAGGPLPNHSVFTGHLLQALEGKAKDNDGNLTANGVISYVYQKVGADSTAQQTPHYGYIHGDGDFIFYPQDFEISETSSGHVDERLVTVPALLLGVEQSNMDDQHRLKELLSEPRFRIQLHDFVAQGTRSVLARTSSDNFPLQGIVQKDSFLERLHAYEEALKETIPQAILLGRWAQGEQMSLTTLLIKRLCDRLHIVAGSTWLIDSRWYPVLLLMYASGLGAVAGDNYKNLYLILHTSVKHADRNNDSDILLTTAFARTDTFYDAFKWIPQHQRHHVPRSEYLYLMLQPFLDDTLFLGGDYEQIFDRFELMLSLEYAHIDHPQEILPDSEVWSPLGRFAWKRFHPTGPLESLIEEAKATGSDWTPIKSGLFGGSLERFHDLANALQRHSAKQPWF